MPEIAGLDLGRILWALLFSVALWAFVQAEVNPDRVDTLELAIEPRNVPSGLIVTNRAEWRPVQVRVSGPRTVMGELRESQVRAYVDLSDAGRTGEMREEEYPIQVSAPDTQVRLSEPTPRRLRVRLEELGTRSVPVRARLDGNPPFGYRPGRADVSPPTVSVTGPVSFLRRIDAAEVEVRLDAATSDINTSMPIALVDSQGDRVRADVPGGEVQPSSARVTVPIAQQLGYKEVGVRPLVRGNVAPGHWVASVSVEPAVVPVVGDPSTLASVAMIETDPVELNGLTGTTSQSVGLQLPSGIALARAEPLVLTVQVASLTLAQSLRVPVIVDGLADDQFLASEVPIVEIVANGSAAQGLSASEVRARADASALGAGVHTLPVRVTLPPGYALQSVQPAAVNVIVQSVGVPTAVPTVPPTPLPTPTAEPTDTPISVATETPTATAAPTVLTPTPSATPSVVSTPNRTPTPTPTPAATRTPTRAASATPRPGER